VAYFNIADLKNSKYYHEKGLAMHTEPDDSRIKQ
jgi:hypothetical protein